MQSGSHTNFFCLCKCKLEPLVETINQLALTSSAGSLGDNARYWLTEHITLNYNSKHTIDHRCRVGREIDLVGFLSSVEISRITLNPMSLRCVYIK